MAKMIAIQIVKSTAGALVAFLVVASIIELAHCGGKGGMGGSDIILYKNNLIIRGNGGGGKGGKGGKGGGQGNLVIASSPQHHGHEHHGDMGHHHGHFHEPQHHKQDNFILAMLRDGEDDKGKGKGNMGNKGGNKGKGGNNNDGGNMVMNINTKQKGNEMNWEELILGGGRF